MTSGLALGAVPGDPVKLGTTQCKHAGKGWYYTHITQVQRSCIACRLAVWPTCARSSGPACPDGPPDSWQTAVPTSRSTLSRQKRPGLAHHAALLPAARADLPAARADLPAAPAALPLLSRRLGGCCCGRPRTGRCLMWWQPAGRRMLGRMSGSRKVSTVACVEVERRVCMG